MNSIQKETLLGYDSRIETARQKMFDEFNDATEPNAKRSALEVFANLTSMRSPIFIAAYEQALGLLHE